MNVISNIREFFWPLLEKVEIPEPPQISQEDITVDSIHLEKTLEYAISCYNAESERRKTVEGKSSLFIGTISVVTTVIVGVTSFLVELSDFSIAVFILLLLLFVLTVYMSRTVWFSIQALERKNYHSISISDFLINGADNNYHKKIISEITNKLRKNSITINSKVDSMTMAQEYFKRAIAVIVIYSVVIIFFFISKSDINFSLSISNYIDLLNRININAWNIIALYILVILSLVISIIAISKGKD